MSYWKRASGRVIIYPSFRNKRNRIHIGFVFLNLIYTHINEVIYKKMDRDQFHRL